MVRRAAVLACLLTATATFADEDVRSLEGMGRIAVQGGYRWTPNAEFMKRAAALGHPVEGGMPGGPQFSASFGYAPLDWIEATIDVFVGFENFRLQDLEQFTSTTYGALLGVRFAKMDFPFRGLVPYFGAQLGPVLSFITGKSIAGNERLNTGYSINAGLTFRVADRWGIGLDARYLFSRGEVPDIATIDAGGLWVSLSITYFIPAGPKDPLGGML
jgi:opacity protein-like surface antigen